MISIACTAPSTCVEVGDGGRIRTTADGGVTWTDAASPFNKALTQVQCPGSAICYAVGDRGTVLKSIDGGTTWSYLQSTDGNPIYGLSCPSASVCYATDIYAHVIKTSDGGATWTWQQTPVTTPGLERARLGRAESVRRTVRHLVLRREHVRRGRRVPAQAGTDPPIVTTTDGGVTWTRQTSNSGTNNYLHSVSCLPGTTTCTAVGRGGSIVTTTDLVTWTKVTSGTTNALNSVTCLSTSFCMAVRPERDDRHLQRVDVDGDDRQRRQRLPRQRHVRRHEHLLRDRQAGRHDRDDQRRSDRGRSRPAAERRSR